MQKIILFIAFLINAISGIAQTGNTMLADNLQQTQLIDKVTIGNTELKPSVLLYPNPSKNKVVIQLKGFVPGMAQVQIINDKGRVVRKEERLLINGTEEVVMFFLLPPGIYYLKIAEKEKEVKKRLVVLQ